MIASVRKLSALLAPILILSASAAQAGSGPASGWTSQPLRYAIQIPYDVSQSDRYGYDQRTKTHHFWVLSSDRPHTTRSHTKPRSEMRIHNDYTSGQHQFEADVLVPGGTSGVSIMQIFGGSGGHATSLQLRVYDGTLTRYRKPIRSNMYDKWFHLNVTHDVESGRIDIYLDNGLALETSDNGGSSWYFKCGVYGQNAMSNRMQAYFRNIKIYTR